MKGAQRFFTGVHNQFKNILTQIGVDFDKYPYLAYVADPYHPEQLSAPTHVHNALLRLRKLLFE